MKHLIPITSWLPNYQSAWLTADVVAGATGWAVIVPLAMACAVLVGVDPIVGLYALPLALLAYAVFGGSRLFVIGPDTTISVLAGGFVASFVATGSDPLSIAVMLALLAAIIYGIFFVLKMGWIADLVPEPVLKGFVEGIVWLTILKQLTALFGLKTEKTSGGFHEELLAVVKALPDFHMATAALGAVSIAILFALKKFAPRVPGAIVVLIVTIALVSALGLDKDGVDVLGTVAGGLPDLRLPDISDLNSIIMLVPSALAVVVIGYTKSLAALKHASEHSGEPIDPDREMLALGVSNLGAGLSGGYPVAGTLTVTSVSVASGAKSQVAGIVMGVLSVLTLLFLLPLLANLAMATLAAIIVVALIGLSDLGYFRRLFKMSRFEFLICIMAFLGVLAFGVLPGVMIGVVLALFKLGQVIHSPVTAVVGRTPGGAFVDIDEHPEAEEVPGVLIWRQYGPLVFLNARILANQLRDIATRRKDTKVIVFDATTAAGVDTTAAEALLGVFKNLKAEGIEFCIVNPRQKGWDMAVASLKAAELAIPDRFDSLSDAVAKFQQDVAA